MLKIAVYGKGGIGKSTTIANVAAVLAMKGYTVMQIGCDPKADSTVLLRHREPVTTVLDLIRERKNDFELEDMVKKGFAGVLCVEAGGPAPGMGCAGRGIIAALEKLQEKGAYDFYRPDIILYDVLGDVVCGGFAMPMRSGYADHVFIVTSGESMSIYAAANIGLALQGFSSRGYARMSGIILNRREVPDEENRVSALAKELGTQVVGRLSRSPLVLRAEEEGKCLLQAFPESEMAEEYRRLADAIAAISLPG